VGQVEIVRRDGKLSGRSAQALNRRLKTGGNGGCGCFQNRGAGHIGLGVGLYGDIEPTALVRGSRPLGRLVLVPMAAAMLIRDGLRRRLRPQAAAP
jgi:hypothetical protein